MAGVAIGMAVLALFVGLGAVVMLHLVKGLLLEVRDQLGFQALDAGQLVAQRLRQAV